jgi:hypothetical protein
VTRWVVTTCQPWKRLVQTKSAAHAVHAVMAAQVATVQAPAVAHVVLSVATPLRPTAATSQRKLVALITMPLSAYARSPRPLQQRTVKENKDAATCSP